MALVNQPPILASSFAVNGDKNTIPTTNSGTEGLASLSLGFPPITQQPVSQGGIPPQRADFNGIFNLITNFLMFIQNGSIFAYSSSLDYQPPAIVYGNNALYRCIATNGANTSAGVQPLSNTAYWKPLIPVGAITISGNVITITNETGAQIQYTIDTINNPPAQSDTSNKIVTSAWVKAYAPSKTGFGASGTWSIDVSGNAGNINKGYAEYAGNFPTNTFRNDVLGREGNGFALRPFYCLLPNGKYGSSPGVGFGSIDTQGFLQMAYNTPIVYVGAGNEGKIKWSKQLAFADGTGASGTWGININGNASTSSKATQDSQGQQINTTYVKGVTGSNSTLTVTKGNGKTSTVTINNVAHAIKTDDATEAGNINKGYAGYAGNFPTNTFRNDVLGREGNGFALRPFYCLLPSGSYGSSPGVGFGAIDTQGFLQVAYNAPIAFIGGGNNDEISWYKQIAFTDSPALTGSPTAPTQGTSDNSTKIATTAFVKSLFAASKTTNGWWKDGSTGIIYQWGVNSMNSTSKSFNFNISFPNSCFIVRAGDVGIGARSVGSSANNNTSFTIYVGNSQPLQFSWFAIGY